MDLFQTLPDDLVVRIFQPFAWHEGPGSDRVLLPEGHAVKTLTALSLTCRRFCSLIKEGSPLWTRVELTGVETCWKDAQLQQSFLSWLAPKQSRWACAAVHSVLLWPIWGRAAERGQLTDQLLTVPSITLTCQYATNYKAESHIGPGWETQNLP